MTFEALPYSKTDMEDTWVNLATIGVLTGVSLWAAVCAWRSREEHEHRRLIIAALFLVPVTLISIFGGFALFIPLRYHVDSEKGVGIERPVHVLWFPWEETSSVRLLQGNELAGLERIAGNGGYFGYTGRWRTPSLGEFQFYATCLTQPLLLVECREGKIILSPENPQEMLAAANKNLMDRTPTS